MVSNVLRISPPELVSTLERMGHDLAEEPEYQSARAELPEEWPF